jgi:pimeloyl-ACP methyl ester carboxylesterase
VKHHCIDIGVGTIYERSLSDPVKELFTFHFDDVPWCGNESTELTNIDDVLTHILQNKFIKRNIKEAYIFGHSAFGLIALEFAHRYPEYVKGIIMEGTPIESSLAAGEVNHSVFLKQADKPRIELYLNRKKELESQDLTHLTFSERFIVEYAYMCSAKYWHQMDFDCSPLWEGIELNQNMDNLFSTILPSLKTIQLLPDIKTPILFTYGPSDYDCCPWNWENLKELPKNFTIKKLEKSGHWPHYEEPEKFYNILKEWLAINELN